MSNRRPAFPADPIENRILLIRGECVIIDADLARFYGVPTKRLNEQVRRNRDRFPEDFLFRLSPEEKRELVANCDQFTNLKHARSLPWAFTEHGAIMAASILNSPRAVAMGVFVVRAFVGLRRNVNAHRDLTDRLDQLERKLKGQDSDIRAIAKALKALIDPANVPKKRRIGFRRY